MFCYELQLRKLLKRIYRCGIDSQRKWKHRHWLFLEGFPGRKRDTILRIARGCMDRLDQDPSSLPLSHHMSAGRGAGRN
eukprot:scaffold4052_cov132-Skeletonema_menzelii.AAC.3